MKVIIASDTHQKRESIEKIVQFAHKEGIDTILDCGDLHGEIDAYEGVKLHSVYWEEASGAMERWRWFGEVGQIGGKQHENGEVFTLENQALGRDHLVYIKHNLADYEDIIPEDAWRSAIINLQSYNRLKTPQLDQLVLFGHTHNFHFQKKDDVIAINPGSLGYNGTFVIYDTETHDVEFCDFEGVIMSIPGDQEEITRVRGHNGRGANYFIAGLRDDKEVIQHADGSRSAEHKQIKQICSYNNGNPIYVAVQDDDHEVVVVDGKPGKEWKEVKKVETTFGHDGPAVMKCYVAKNDHDMDVAVIGTDEREFATYDEITKLSVEESGDVLIEAKQGKDDDAKSLVNYNGVESRLYDSISSVAVLEGKMAFVAKEGEETFVVFDGEEQQRFKCSSYKDRIAKPEIIAGKLTYVVEQNMGGEGSEEFVVHGDERSASVRKKGYDSAIKCVQSIDGKLAYVASPPEEDDCVIVGGEVVLRAPQISAVHNLDGKLIYNPERWGDKFVVEGREIVGYRSIHEIKKAVEDGELKL